MTVSAGSRPSLADLEAEILRFTRDFLLEGEFDGVDPLAEREIDSLALEQLLDHLEETYLILFDPEDITRANLSSVATAARMVDARIVAVAAGQRGW